MNFDYYSIRDNKPSGGTQWAAYSDLFMVLAFIFLLMYMVSSLRISMVSVATHSQIAEAQKEIEVYESIKDEYLKENAGQQEQKAYKEVLEQLSLLESEANQNKQRLAQEHQQQVKRESDLNQYQRMLKALINANMVAKVEAAEKMSSEQQHNMQLAEDIERKRSLLASLENKLQQESAEKAVLENTHAKVTRNLEHEFQSLQQKHHQDKNRLTSLANKLEMEAAEKAVIERESREIER